MITPQAARMLTRYNSWANKLIFDAVAGHPPLAELWRKQQVVDDWYIAWSERMSEAALGENVPFTLIGGNKGVMTRAEILLHIVNHTSYHRGFVADLFYQVPGA